MNIEPIEQQDLSFRVYERIREMILSGEFLAGEKLPQEKIAMRLGVSRMPLHKAFVMLEDEFLVESIPRRGIFVRKPDIQAIIDAFECREGLESVAARRSAVKLSEEEIDEMERLFEPFLYVDAPDADEYRRADQLFHEHIISASGNRVMQKLNNLGSVLIRTYPKGIILPLKVSLEDHRQIIAAFRQRDPDNAEKLVREHSRKARHILEQELDSKQE